MATEHKPGHESAVLPNATNRIVAVFDTTAQARHAADALKAIVGPDGDFNLRCGVHGARAIGFDAREQSGLAKAQRVGHWLTDDKEMDRFQEELQAGHCLLSFSVGLTPDLESIADLLRAEGGHFIHHFGPMVVTTLEP